MMKFIKNNKGFTLVEVIVVAVIVLILAAVAIPLYQGYVKESRINVASNIAGTIAAGCGAVWSLSSGTDDCNEGNIRGGTFYKYGAQTGKTGNDVVGVNIPEGYVGTVTSNSGLVTVCYGTTVANNELCGTATYKTTAATSTP